MATGAVFALVRFVAVWKIQDDIFGHTTDSLLGVMLWIAAPASAGLSGGLLWWLLVRRPSFLKRGALAGLLAALFSYVGLGLVFIASGGVDHFASGLELAILAPIVTGWIVFPVLTIVGVLLSWLQKKLVDG